MGEAITGSVYQAKFGLVTANGQFYTGAVAGDFVIISQTGSTIWGNSGGERMRLNTNGTVSIGNTNNTFKLDVTGTGRFTGQLTLGSTITNGTYTYTLPSATGTLALTSDLSSYVPTSRTVSTTSPLSGGGALSSDLTLSISQASGSANGYLSSTDWTTFNNKQNALTNPVTGTGTTNYVPKFTGTSTIGNSLIYDNGTNVGIGTASPSRLLNISGGGTDGTQVQINGTVDSAGIKLIPTSGDNWEIQANTSNQFFVYNRTDSAYRFLIDGSGNVGIGTTTVSGRLTLNNPSSDGSTPLISIRDTSNVYEVGYLNFNQSTDMMTLMNKQGFSGSGIAFGTNNTERMRITSGGDVGIGTTTVSEKLDVEGNINLRNSNTYSTSLKREIIYRSNTQIYGVQPLANIIFSTTGTVNSAISFVTRSSAAEYGEKMRISDVGNVGIGTTSPSGAAGLALAINGGASQTRIALKNSFTGDAAADGFQILLDAGSADVALEIRETGSMRFATSDTERMRITSGGLVGIGTSSPTNKLTLYNTVSYNQVNDQLRLIGNNSGGGSSSTPSYNGGIAFTQDATDFAYIRSIQSNPANSWDSRLGFWTLNGNGGTPIERMSIDNNGNILIGSITAAYNASNRSSFEVNGATQSLIALKSGDVKQGYFFVTANGGDMYLTKDTGTNSFIFQNQSNGVYLSVGSTSWSSISDIRLKNINSNIENAVDSLMTLKTINYSWKSDADKKENLGLIAQEVEKVFPQVISKSKFKGNNATNISEDDTEYLSVRYAELVPVLIKAIQELKAEINELKNK
jgi:hypothetical protein